jgi:hypothetical protein
MVPLAVAYSQGVHVKPNGRPVRAGLDNAQRQKPLERRASPMPTFDVRVQFKCYFDRYVPIEATSKAEALASAKEMLEEGVIEAPLIDDDDSEWFTGEDGEFLPIEPYDVSRVPAIANT